VFTGIVEEVGRVAAVRMEGGEGRLTIAATKVMEDLALGDSIAVNGVCLTVVQRGEGTFTLETMPETLRRTNLGRLEVGDPVNLERAARLGGKMGGHLVQGHIEGTGRLVEVTREATAIVQRYQAPPEIMRYIVPKGFIALDGVSLTVMDCQGDTFRVSLVAFTQENTILGAKEPGYIANLETDILGKYVERFIAATGR